MDFRLLYRGELPPNGNVAEKFAIRRQFHRQLRQLWTNHPSLIEMAESEGSLSGTTENLREVGFTKFSQAWSRYGFDFLPLAFQEVCLRCSIDVLFLRREKPGSVYMKGDIDNRLKTLFDALQMPVQAQEAQGETPSSDECPFFVLLENDEQIADVSVTTGQLLDFPVEHQHVRNYCVLVIGVKLQPTHAVRWSWVFS